MFAVTFKTYPRPIPTPVHNLRPARETCEACHWPQKYGEDRVRVINKFADDETNSLTKTVLLMKIGGGNHGIGIHGTHLGPGVTIRYAATDEQRQNIPWVEYNGPRPADAVHHGRRQARRRRRTDARDGLHGLPQPSRRTVTTCRSAAWTKPWPPG